MQEKGSYIRAVQHEATIGCGYHNKIVILDTLVDAQYKNKENDAVVLISSKP